MTIAIVCSGGRSGTNLALESLRGNPYFKVSNVIEDKYVFVREEELIDRYLTKTDVVYCPTYKHFKQFMIKNSNANIIWTVRHPYDWCLSKLYRGRPTEKSLWKYSADATIRGCLMDMSWMYSLLKELEKDYPLRIIRVRMEDLILNIETEPKEFVDAFAFFGIKK